MQSKGSQKKWNSKILLENYYWKIALILCVCKRYESWLLSIYVLESVWDSCEDTNGKMAQGYKEKKNYRNHFKGCFSEGKVWRGKFIVEPAMGKQVIWRGKRKNTFQKWVWTIREKMLVTQKYVSERELTHETWTQKEVQEREVDVDSSAHPKRTVCGNFVKTSMFASFVITCIGLTYKLGKAWMYDKWVHILEGNLVV